MKTLFLIGLFFFQSLINAQAQRQAFIDSLADQAQKTSTDTLKIKLYTRISDWYIDNDISKALVYADTVAAIAKRVNQGEGIAASLVNYGNIYNFKGEYSKAIGYFNKALVINKELKSVRGMANNLYSLGSANERLSNYPDATSYYFESLRLNESFPDNEQAVASCLGGLR